MLIVGLCRYLLGLQLFGRDFHFYRRETRLRPAKQQCGL